MIASTGLIHLQVSSLQGKDRIMSSDQPTLINQRAVYSEQKSSQRKIVYGMEFMKIVYRKMIDRLHECLAYQVVTHLPNRDPGGSELLQGLSLIGCILFPPGQRLLFNTVSCALSAKAFEPDQTSLCSI